LTGAQFKLLNGLIGLLFLVAPPIAFLKGFSFTLPSFLPFSPAAMIFARTGVNASYVDYAIVVYGIFIALTYRLHVNARTDAHWSALKDQPLEVQVDSRNDLLAADIKGFLITVAAAGFFAVQQRLSFRIELGQGAAIWNLAVYILFFVTLFPLLRSHLSRKDQAIGLTERSEELKKYDAPVRASAREAFNRGGSSEAAIASMRLTYEDAQASTKTIQRENKSIFREPKPPAQSEVIFKERRLYFAFLGIVVSIGLIFVTVLFVAPFVTEPARTAVEEVEGVVVESLPPTGNCNMGSRHNYNYGVVTIRFTMSNGQFCTITTRTCRIIQTGSRVGVQPASWTYCGGNIQWWPLAPPLSSRWNDDPRNPTWVDPNRPKWSN
jgi:hypothetical protein